MSQAFPARRTRNRVAAHDAATRAAASPARTISNSSSEAFGTPRKLTVDRWRPSAGSTPCQREERGASGIIGTMVGLLILAVVSYGAYTFVVSSGLLH